MAKAGKKKKKEKKKEKKKAARLAAKPKAAKSAKKKAAKPAARKAASKKIDPLNRKQYGAMTPMLAVRDVRGAVDFYRDAFGFKVRAIMDSPSGPLHAELRLRDTTLMLSPESPQQQSLGALSIGNTPTTLYILVDDVDGIFKQAVSRGANVVMPVMDMFWGDRCGMVTDPEGNKWMIATHKAEPTEAEMAAAMQQSGQGGPPSSEAAAAGSESEY